MDVSAIKARLVSRKGDWPRIRDEAHVSYSWLSKFANGHIPSPGILTLERLAAVLDQHDRTAA